MSWTGWALLVLLGAALAVWGVDVRAGLDRRRTRLAFASALAVLVAYVAARWAVTGHPPVRGTVENVVAALTALVGMCAYALWRERPWRDAAVAASAPWMAALPTASLWFADVPVGLGAGEASLVGYAHAVFGWASFAALVLTVGCGALLVVRGRGPNDAPAWLPSAEQLGHWAHLAALWGFVLLTANMVLGLAFGVLLFGGLPRIEVVQIASIVLWLALGGLIHARMHFRWRGAALGRLSLILVPLMVLSFWGGSIVRDTFHNTDVPVTRAGAIR